MNLTQEICKKIKKTSVFGKLLNVKDLMDSTKPEITCSKLTIETLEKDVEYVQS